MNLIAIIVNQQYQKNILRAIITIEWRDFWRFLGYFKFKK